MSFWHKFDKILTKAEKKGFETANKAHIWTVNILVCGTLYGIYTLFRDYNEFFIDARTDPNKENGYLPPLQEDREAENPLKVTKRDRL